MRKRLLLAAKAILLTPEFRAVGFYQKIQAITVGELVVLLARLCVGENMLSKLGHRPLMRKNSAPNCTPSVLRSRAPNLLTVSRAKRASPYAAKILRRPEQMRGE